MGSSISLRCYKYLPLIAYVSIFVSAICSHAEEQIEDLVDLFEFDSKIVAILEGKRERTVSLRPYEQVLWSGSKGTVGAFFTNRRFFVISTSSKAWRQIPLKIDEAEDAAASLSPNIALLVTGERAIGYDAVSNRFHETHLPIYDEMVTTKVEKYVAVVITSSRAFGLAAEGSSFAEIHLRVRETIEEIKITSSKATIRTSRRLLSFEASNSSWNEYRLY